MGNVMDAFSTPHERSVEEELKDELAEAVFGPRPSGPRTLRRRFDQMEWDTVRNQLAGVVPLPFKIDIGYYQRWGLGEPVMWESHSGRKYISFPEAKLLRDRIPPNSAVLFPKGVVAEYQRDLIREGIAVEELHEWLQGSEYDKMNEKLLSGGG